MTWAAIIPIPGTVDYGPCVAIEYFVDDLQPWIVETSSGHAALLSAARRDLETAGYGLLTSSQTRRINDDGEYGGRDRIRIVFGLATDA